MKMSSNIKSYFSVGYGAGFSNSSETEPHTDEVLVPGSADTAPREEGIYINRARTADYPNGKNKPDSAHVIHKNQL